MPATVFASLALAPDDLPAGTQVGDYVVESKLGEGGMATVYLAVHPLIGKKVAVKVMSPKLSLDASAVDRFVHEARSVNQIGHPNIVDVFSFGKLTDGRSYFVMECLAGQTLAARLAEGPVPYHDAATILIQICEALDAAHAVGIVHRDLKPENVFLVPVRGGRTLVKLLDFGLAKLATDEEQGIRRTLAGMVIGTPAYISPEQARAANVDHRTDIYALGVMMFELFVGHLPFEADSVLDLVHMQLYDTPPDIHALAPALPRPIASSIMRMLSKEQDARPSLAVLREVLGLLRDASLDLAAPEWRLRHDDTPLATGPVPSDDEVAAEPKSRRGRFLLVAGAMLVMIAMAGIGLWLRPRAAPMAPTLVAPPPAVAPVVAATPSPAVAKPATLVLHLDTACVVALDGRTVASGNEARVTVDVAGPHELVITARDRAPLKQAILLSPGQTLELSLSLPSPRPRPRATRARSNDTDYMVDPFGSPRKP